MRKLIAVSVLIVIGFESGYAQSAREYLKKGEVEYNAKRYEQALAIYQDGLKRHPKDSRLNFKTGLTYLSLPSKAESLRYLQSAFNSNPSVDENIYYYLGLSYQSNKQFQKAQEFFIEHKKRHKDQSEDIDKKIKQSAFADSLTRVPSIATVENVGKAINSSFHEYSPLLSGDGNTMIFTSNRPDGVVQGPKRYEDIYISRRVNGQWSKPEKISPNINIRFNDAAASLSGDGKTLILYYEYGGGDIYVSKLEGNEWSKPLPLNKNINTPGGWETSAFVTSDGNQIYFTSNRPGGLGSLDIYVSEMELTGDWGQAKNLGPVINTTGREDSPALDHDGKTLYFSSDGHPNMGGTDIFRSEFKDGKWQKPINLGHPINSVEDDSFFAISGDKRKAYFSTLREEGNSEIYTLTFIEPEQVIAAVPSEPLVQEMKVADPAVKPPVVTNKTPSPVTKATPSKDKPAASTGTPRRTAASQPSSTPTSKRFLFFAIGKDELNAESLRKLNDVYSLLRGNTQVRSLIEGHTDNTGSAILNNALSISRANQVAKFLTRKGIEPARLTVKAYGARRPLVSNDDEVGGREINRRIEIALINRTNTSPNP